MGTIKTVALPMVTVAIMASGCGNGYSDATPKPSAYHRIETPDSIFYAAEVKGVEMLLNTESQIKKETRNGDEWLNIGYPQFPGSLIHLTLSLTTPEQFSSMLANREERFRLDVGNVTTEIIELVSDGGWHCAIFVSRSCVTTPIHILASNPAKTKLLSGILHINTPENPSATPDSVSPIVTTYTRDMLTLLKNISEK